ncbi:MAG TPA: MraY family glycosyltransferase [Chthonomonadales bacterium]|nr:MraY family glycosyltransferase [Chthonomonadales bacterium]
MYGIVAAALIAALITAGLTPLVLRWSERLGAVDQPGERRVNVAPMPRLGGIAIYIGFLVAVLLTVSARQLARSGQHTWSVQVVGVIVAVTFIALTSLIDDLKNLSAKWQALAIVAAALILVAFGIRIQGVTNPLSSAFGTSYNPNLDWRSLSRGLSVFITVVWVFIVTKTVDAIDGVDGLAAGVCAIAAATLALMSTLLHLPTLALMSAAITGACLGFLRFNYHPAKIIMGTIGAQVLGLTLAAISIMGAFKVATAVSVLVPVLVLGVPIFDFTHVLARRLLERAPLTVADKRHLHHRLLERGWNQRQVVWFIYGVAIALSVTALVIFQARGR